MMTEQPSSAKALVNCGRSHRLPSLPSHCGFIHTTGVENLENTGLPGYFTADVSAAGLRHRTLDMVWLCHSLQPSYFN